MTNARLEELCDQLEKIRAELALDPATRKAADHIKTVTNDLSLLLAKRDNATNDGPKICPPQLGD